MVGINVENNNCTRCFGGLVQIHKVHADGSQIRIKIDNIQCSNNIGGYWGCLLITKHEHSM